MPRVWDWVEQLHGCLDRHAVAEFEYGTADCGLFAARCVDAITGSAWEQDLAAHYQTEFGAARFVVEAGGIEAAVTARLGEPIAPLQAMRGDVVLLPGEDGPCLGVSLGETVAAMRPEGVRYVPAPLVLKAWAVGRG